MVIFHYYKSLACNAILLPQTSFNDFMEHSQRFHLPAVIAVKAAAGSKLLELATTT